MTDGTSLLLLQRYRWGDERAAYEIHDRYVERLKALVQKRLASSLRRRVDPEDVVQSAYRSFFRRARGKAYTLRQSGDLWRLLAQFARHKLLKQVERHTANRRNLAIEQEASDLASRLANHEPGPADVAACIEQLRRILDMLSPLQRNVFHLTLNGNSVADVAGSLQRSPRTVRRILESVRQLIEQEIGSIQRTSSNEQIAHNQLHFETQLKYSDFVLEKLVGSGGMGKVYRAVRKVDQQQVAIKALLKRRQSDGEAVLQFVREARYVSRLNHPGIVAIHGLGQFPSGGYFLVMDFVEGTNLAQQLKSSTLDVQTAVHIALKISSAMQYAHDQGVLHCDLKPSNVLLNTDDHVFVSDFGMARLIQPSRLDTIVIPGGTPAFMAPEQFDRSYGEIGVATDIFGLGGILYASLTGRAPRRPLRHEKQFRALLNRPVIEIQKLNPSVSSELSAICQRCLMRDPAARYASFADVIGALQALNVTQV